ncbi:hypothetical protein OG874_19640 [Nocardia sp. NBC_00565]|uniref:hypothetical protein n=1 Tax=Nocardia sp. NBC_00565 TaxID=2975993 RepID=UPI002E815BCA|nr:hypothetical protein [Nocardia sp. NBC_00565]WUC07169.1 hypothetical protein OG874_19640 [Nocardia sp. NBC_00565]
MTDTPSPKPNEPAGLPEQTGGAPEQTGGAPEQTGGAPEQTGGAPERTGGAPEEGGGEQFAARPGQHESPDPQPKEPGVGPGRHEMAGTAGYPQFEGPGAAQYGSEPVEPPPPVGTPSPAATGQPSYGPPGTGPMAPPLGYAPPPGAMAPHPGAMQPGTPPGAAPPGAMQPGAVPPGGMPPPGAVPPPGYQPGQPTYGYQSAPGVPMSLDVGNALSYGWEKFRANIGPWLAVTAVGVIIYLGFVLVIRVVEPNSLFSLLLIFLAVMVAIWLLQAAMIRGALYETDGNKPTFASYFHFVNAGNVLLTALLAFALTWIGAALCFIPGLIAGFLCMFALHFVVDQEQGPFTAIKSSATLVIGNIGQVLLLALAVLVITFVGALLCGFGLLVAGPVCTIAVTYAYRALTGGTVSV